jgi:NAD(P)-dependent dehydrogenase (short-subunit alcohol dehydrogenase family)
MSRLEGKVALVTGASKGIGAGAEHGRAAVSRVVARKPRGSGEAASIALPSEGAPSADGPGGSKWGVWSGMASLTEPARARVSSPACRSTGVRVPVAP